MISIPGIFRVKMLIADARKGRKSMDIHKGIIALILIEATVILIMAQAVIGG